MEQTRPTDKPIRSEIVPLHQAIQDRDILHIIACPGVEQAYFLETLSLGEYKAKVNKVTQSRYIAREGTVVNAHGEHHKITITRDASAVSASIYSSTSSEPLVQVTLRDRKHDGTLEATPAHYLHIIDEIPDEEIPHRSKDLGVVDWHYSSQQDIPAEGVRSVELSVRSSDPRLFIHEPLNRKAREGKLWSDPQQLTEFIENPFAAIPSDPTDEEALQNWYKHWWQVVNRVLHGNSVPLPGQTASGAFDQFLEHVVSTTADKLRPQGYTHLSAVPTWSYVWDKFKRLGFTADHPDIDKKAHDFFEKLSATILPHPTRRGEEICIDNFIQRKALIAWLAVLPFAVNANPNFTPHPDIPPSLAESFQRVFQIVQQNLKQDTTDLLATYPLAPGKNLWLSLAL